MGERSEEKGGEGEAAGSHQHLLKDCLSHYMLAARFLAFTMRAEAHSKRIEVNSRLSCQVAAIENLRASMVSVVE